MKTSDFDFDLPQELIAQTPLENRQVSKLLVAHKNTQTIEHKHFYDIVDYFKKGDVLVRNNTKVIPARLFGTKAITNARVEVLLLKQHDNDIWECLVGNAKVVKEGVEIIFSDKLKGTCVKVEDKGIRYIQMHYEGIFLNILEEIGHMPLPPYIKERLNDKNRYQTVYAKIDGSAAAPTAGLHFTDAIFEQLKEKGVIITDVTLHVGLGTFLPVNVEDIKDHHMHLEQYEMTQETADILNQARTDKRRIITVGTTSTRTLEAIFQKYNTFKACNEETDIFIYPGYHWKAVDCIITNFHLPKSTLIMMISSFAGQQLIMKAYQQAIQERYRFFSFGDAMLIDNE